MANALYDKARKSFCDGDFTLLTDNIRAVLVDSTYTVDLVNHDFYDDLSGVVGTETGLLGTKTTNAGVFDAADFTFTAPTGNTAVALILFVDTGTASTDRLIAFIDTAFGLPLVPAGLDVTVAVDTNGIFKL